MTKPTSRSCGGCTACCFTHSIRTLNKPVATTCGHCSAGAGCAIYGNHPDECKGYACVWLMREFPDDMRPDRLGVVADFLPKEVTKTTFQVVRVWEVWPNALASKRAQVLLLGLLQVECMVVLHRLHAGKYTRQGYASTTLGESLIELLKSMP